MEQALLRKSFRFEAAHHLLHHKGQCARDHGHSYRLEVFLYGPIQEVVKNSPDSSEGMVMDFGDVSAVVKEHIITKLDHYDLNDVVPVPVTTAELVACWIRDTLLPHIPNLVAIRLWETEDGYAEVYVNGTDYKLLT